MRLDTYVAIARSSTPLNCVIGGILAPGFSACALAIHPSSDASVVGTNPAAMVVRPGFEVAATVATSLHTLTEVWRGDLSWMQAVRSGELRLDAPGSVRRQVPDWIGQSLLAAVPRP